MQYKFSLTGEMPLLLHADDIEAADALKAWRIAPENKNLSVPGDDRSPAWSWQSCLYSDGEHIAMPSQNVMVALRQAGAQIVMKKQKTFKEVSQSGMVITSEFCDFKVKGKQVPIKGISWQDSSEAEPTTFREQCELAESRGFKLFVKRARIGQSKNVRVRPRFDTWSVSGELNVVAAELTFEVLQKMFELAGRVGLGDWRPGCKTPGPYGMFEAKLMKA